MDIVVGSSPAFKELTPEEAANKAGRSAVGRALGWSLIVPIISIPVAVAASAIHTSKVNDQIVRDFAAQGFSDGDIMSNKERSGFLFFELADGPTDLGNLTLEVTARNVATAEIVNLPKPLPSSILKSETQAQAQEAPQEAKSSE